MSNSREFIDISNWTHRLSIVNADDNAGGSITLENIHYGGSYLVTI